MLKKFIGNTLLSFLVMFLMGLAFTFVGFFLLDLFKPLIAVLFCALLFLGYCIGHKLHYSKGIGLASIVILPLLMVVASYVLCIVGVPVVSMLFQYPAAVWIELFIKDIHLADNNPVLFYAIAFLNYLAYALSLFVGAYKKAQTA